MIMDTRLERISEECNKFIEDQGETLGVYRA